MEEKERRKENERGENWRTVRGAGWGNERRGIDRSANGARNWPPLSSTQQHLRHTSIRHPKFLDNDMTIPPHRLPSLIYLHSPYLPVSPPHISLFWRFCKIDAGAHGVHNVAGQEGVTWALSVSTWETQQKIKLRHRRPEEQRIL